MSKAKIYLREMLIKDWQWIGSREDLDDEVLDNIVDAWMNDQSNSKHRYDVIKREMPEAHKILDMASGTGTFVNYGLLNGYDCYGIDPEDWKFEFIKMKAQENHYPEKWHEKFIKGYGENMPFEDDNFDLTSSYQTLEHVQDVKQCIREMLRVTKSGGGVHIMCPDYISTFEGHYMLPWLPLFPRKLANMYLRLRGRNTKYLTTLNYTTSYNIKKYILYWAKKDNLVLEILDLNKEAFYTKFKKKNLYITWIQLIKFFYFLYYMLQYSKKLFKSEMNINYFIKVKKVKD